MTPTLSATSAGLTVPIASSRAETIFTSTSPPLPKSRSATIGRLMLRAAAVPSLAARSAVTPAFRRPMAGKTWMPSVVRGSRVSRRPQPRVVRGEGEAEGRDADDLVVAIVERHPRADDVVAAAEALLPERVAQDDDAVTAFLLLVGAEEPAPGRCHAEQREEARADTSARHLFGAGIGAPQEALRAVGGEPLQRARVVPRVEGQAAQIVAERADRALVLFGDAHQLFGLGIGEWAQEHPIDDRNQRGGDAEAQRKGQEGRKTGGLRAGERAHGVAEVVAESVHALHFRKSCARPAGSLTRPGRGCYSRSSALAAGERAGRHLSRGGAAW